MLLFNPHLLLSLCTALAQSPPGLCLHCMTGSQNSQASIKAVVRVTGAWNSVSLSLAAQREGIKGVNQQKLQLILSFFFSQLDNSYYLQKTPGLEGSCQYCSGTAHLDQFLKF